jgi:predicted signal transduction protein with EAL and GGDEF domain
MAVHELLHHADLAMYADKRRKSTGWVCYDATLAESGGTSLEDDLRQAVAAGQLRLQYRPIVALPDGGLTGVEALVRWQHPTRGLLDPEEFIPLEWNTPPLLLAATSAPRAWPVS